MSWRDSSNIGVTGKDNYDEDGIERDQRAKKQPKKVVVGLHIGATVSGSAFCCKKKGHWSQIQMNNSWVNEYGIKTTTIPTAVVESDRDCKFGHDAIITYTKASNPKEYSFLETQKLQFKKKTIDDSEEDTLRFLEITIKELKESVELQLKNSNLWSSNVEASINWIVTCADVMKYDLTKDFLKEIIRSPSIHIIPEDKAAAVWCAEMPMYELTEQMDPSLKEGTFYCVTDVESQYISIFKKKGTMSVETLATQSFTLDLPQKYEKLFGEVFERKGETTISEYKQDHPRDWFVMLKDIQTQINGFVNSKEMQIILSLPFTFVKYFRHVTTYDSKSVMLTRDRKLVIKPAYFSEIFDSCASQILIYLNGLNNTYSYPISFLFLIGKATLLGRAISKSITEKKSFPKVTIKDIKEPEDSGACALKGSVLVGRALASR